MLLFILIDHLLLLRFVVPDVVGKVKPRLELRQRTEDVWEQKVQKRPKLGQVVLERRAGEQQLVRGGNVLELANELAVNMCQEFITWRYS